MNELSHRLQLALDFLNDKGYERSDAEIARKMGVQITSLNMAKTGARIPTWDLLLRLCDNYPINFWWLRTGNGSMVRVDREALLLEKIEQLENRIKELEK